MLGHDIVILVLDASQRSQVHLRDQLDRWMDLLKTRLCAISFENHQRRQAGRRGAPVVPLVVIFLNKADILEKQAKRFFRDSTETLLASYPFVCEVFLTSVTMPNTVTKAFQRALACLICQRAGYQKELLLELLANPRLGSSSVFQPAPRSQRKARCSCM